MDWLLFVLCLFPGIVLPRGRGESVVAWLTVRFLISVGVNGLLFQALCHAGLYSTDLISPYVFAGAGAVCFVGWRASKTRVRVTNPSALAVVALALLASAYWAWFFPPRLWDSTFYHLPIVEAFAAPERFAGTFASEHRIGWLLRGVSGGSLFEAFLSVFRLYEAETYRLVSPLFLVALLGGTLTAGRLLGLGQAARTGACLLVLSAPAVLEQASDYYNDVHLAAYLVAAVTVLLRVTRRRAGRSAIGYAILAGLLLGFACWTKKSGVLTLALPAGVVVLGGRRMKHARGALALATGVALAVAAVYLARIPGFPRYPAAPQSAEPGAFLSAFLADGLPTLLLGSHHLNAAVLVGAMGLAIARVAGWIRPRRPFYEIVLAGVAAFWLAGALFGVFKYGRLDYFDRWGRFLLPVYPLISLLVVHWSAARLESTVSKTARVVTAGLLLASLMFVPYTRLAKVAVYRYGPVSAHPLASRDLKMRATFGRLHDAITFVNARFERCGDGRVLSEDNRVHFFRPEALEAFAVPPNTSTVEACAAWAARANVRWIVASDRARDFAFVDRERSTAVEAFLRSAHAAPLARFGPYVVFEVRALESHAPTL